MAQWECAVRLDADRRVTAGSISDLARAARRGADVRGYTTFDYGTHMAVPGSTEGLVEEMMAFGVVYWLAGDHLAAIQTTRYPANCSLGFMDMPSLSFFLNNAGGCHGIARPFLDGRRGEVLDEDYSSPHYVVLDHADDETGAPCQNFHYRFDEYAWWVRDDWREVLAHEADGTVTGGSLAELQEAFRTGCSLKVGVRGLGDYLAPAGAPLVAHEVFVELHSVYCHTDQGYLGGESQPVVRVAPGVPLRYASGHWDYGWILPRTDGQVHHLIIDPHTHRFQRSLASHAMRWLVR